MNMRDILLKAPDSQLDASMKPLIEKWSDPPTAIQILEALDWCIHCSLASSFVVASLQAMLSAQMAAESVSHEQLVPQATWREKFA